MRVLRILSILGLFCIASHGYAQVKLPAEEGKPLAVSIAKTEMSRLTIQGGRAKSFRYVDGELEVTHEDENGVVFFKPLVTKKIQAFVTSELGRTYLLVMSPTSDLSQDLIILEEEALALKAAQQNSLKIPETYPIVRTEHGYLTAIMRMMQVMRSGDLPSDIDRVSAGVEVPLWDGVVFVREASYSSADLMGESYRLMNGTGEAMVLAEPEFFKKGVLAVSIQKSILSVGESSSIFIVSERQE